MNLLEPPFGSSITPLSRALWAERLRGEKDAPERRIVHTRAIHLPCPARVDRLGLQSGRGYFKCGSDASEPDSVTDVRVLGGDGTRWEVIGEAHGVTVADARDAVTWVDLGGKTTSAVAIEMRRARVDGWWPSWNLSLSGLVLEGELLGADAAAGREGLLDLARCDLDGLPRGVSARLLGGEVRYRTRKLEIGFRLRRAALAFLGIDEFPAKPARETRSLLLAGTYDSYRHWLREYLTQGIRLAPVAGPAAASWFAYDVEGETRVEGNRVSYAVRLGSTGVAYRMAWEVLADRVLLSVERTGERDLRAWESGALHVSFDCRVAPMATLGRVTRRGETGLMELPVLVHAPGHGTLAVTATSGSALWRADAARPLFAATGELKVGEVPQPEGDYLLPAGRHAVELELKVGTPRLVTRLAPDAPAEVKVALGRYALTALPWRADVATFSNNGCSQQAPLCMDLWSALALHLKAPVKGLKPAELLRLSVERWLDGGQGYASGTSSRTMRTYDDEYLHTGVACLQGVADYLEATGDRRWLKRYGRHIGAQLAAMRGRDVDGDGLIESTIRLGISGRHQWSTNWLDVCSFGWKDAWSNALLYPVLGQLARVLPALGRADIAEGLADWAARLRAAYLPTFYNEATGWIAGWRCREDRLHDHAFAFVNGCAVANGLLDAPLARGVMERLWAELGRSGFDDFRLGIPFNLRKVPDEDMGTWNYARPMGWYANGGVTLSQARWFIAALYAVGMRDEADRLLTAMCGSLADGSAIGGCGSGVDLRTWDGSPCGYEGLLCDQLGVLVPAIDRWAKKGR